MRSGYRIQDVMIGYGLNVLKEPHEDSVKVDRGAMHGLCKAVDGEVYVQTCTICQIPEVCWDYRILPFLCGLSAGY